MTSSFVRALAAGLRDASRIVMVTILFVTVSGSLTPALQGVAWIEMAKEAGGIHKIADAIFEFAPCERCRVVERLRQHTTENPAELPAPSERSESPRLFATLVEEISSPGARDCRILEKFPIAFSDAAPGWRADRPIAPPPRGGDFA